MGQFKRGILEGEQQGYRPVTLADLAALDVDVFSWCNRCGLHGPIETARLSAELGPDFPVPEVGARLRCTGCGTKDVATRPGWLALGDAG